MLSAYLDSEGTVSEGQGTSIELRGGVEAAIAIVVGIVAIGKLNDAPSATVDDAAPALANLGFGQS